MCLAHVVVRRTTTASVELRRILTAVDAAPSQGADVEEDELLEFPILPLSPQIFSYFVSQFYFIFSFSNLFPGYMGLIYTLKTIVFVLKQNASCFFFWLSI